MLLQAKVFSDAQKNVHLLSTSRYLICLKYNSNFACNLSENCRLQLCAFLTSHSQKKTYSFIFLRQILIRYDLKISFSKLVKVLVLVLELFYGTRTRVHFSISVLVLEVSCGTRTCTRKLSTRLHHCKLQRWSREHKARGQDQGQGHKKNPRPRPRTAFPRTDTLEAKDRNARGQGQGPRTQSASALQKKKKKVLTKMFQAISKKKKGLHKNFSSDLHEKTFSKKFFNRSTKF